MGYIYMLGYLLIGFSILSLVLFLAPNIKAKIEALCERL